MTLLLKYHIWKFKLLVANVSYLLVINARKKWTNINHSMRFIFYLLDGCKLPYEQDVRVHSINVLHIKKKHSTEIPRKGKGRSWKYFSVSFRETYYPFTGEYIMLKEILRWNTVLLKQHYITLFTHLLQNKKEEKKTFFFFSVLLRIPLNIHSNLLWKFYRVIVPASVSLL